MEKVSSMVYVFDLDGVITNPADSSVNDKVIQYISNILSGGGYVAVNTGRSYVWVEQNFVRPLQDKDVSHAFGRLYVVCEKGGESMLWQDGYFEGQPSRFALSSQAYQITKKAFSDHRSELTTMFWDVTKRTMATIEKVAKADLDEFHEQQKHLAALLKQRTQDYKVRVDATTIATDVESPDAGKRAGAELIYEWAGQHVQAAANTFTCFGDSVSDYEMARYFAQRGARATFVFVGKPSDVIAEDSQVKMVRTQAQYDAGALEYLAAAGI